MSEWKPIETAPKDRLILCYDVYNFYPIYIGAWKFGEWQDTGYELSLGKDPTYWMDLPKTPDDIEKFDEKISSILHSDGVQKYLKELGDKNKIDMPLTNYKENLTDSE